MKGVVRKLFLIIPLVALTSIPLVGEVKTTDRTSVKFEGMLGRVVGFFGGKGAKEGIESTVAVKGDRKATFNDSTGQIVDLAEEKVYDLDMKKKTYTVTTFDEIRQKMREAEERARKEEKEEPGGQPEAQKPEKPQKEYEVDFDVKDTGQKKQLAGYDVHEVIATATVREKGKTLEDGGGVVMTNDMWLAPEIPQLREVAEFDMRYWRQLQQGAVQTTISPEQMAMVMASFPGVRSAMERFAKEGDTLKGTPLDITSTFDGVKSQEQMTQEQQQSNDSGGGGGLTGMFAKKLMKKKQAPSQRATIFTTHHEVLSVNTTVAASDVAIPADFKEKQK
jgi:hypothetical protein